LDSAQDPVPVDMAEAGTVAVGWQSVVVWQKAAA